MKSIILKPNSVDIEIKLSNLKLLNGIIIYINYIFSYDLIPKCVCHSILPKACLFG